MLLPPRILVPLSGAPHAAAAIPVAVHLAAGLNAEVVLLRVVLPPSPEQWGIDVDRVPLVDLAERRAGVELRRYAAAFDGLPVACVVLVGTDPAAEIVGWLRVHRASFAVVARRDHRPLRDRLTRGVTQALQRSGLASVIVVSAAVPPPIAPSPAGSAAA